VVSLSEKNKRYLLQDAINSSRHSMAETETLGARLEHFNLPGAKESSLKYTAQTKAPLRLVSSLGRRLEKQSQHHFQSFIALSCCWHSDDWTPMERCRQLDSWPLCSVTLRESLNQRKSQGEGLWIDACCIDQNDIVEKRHAIGAMDAIYRSARQVVIALEVFSLSDEQGILLQEVLANKFY